MKSWRSTGLVQSRLARFFRACSVIYTFALRKAILESISFISFRERNFSVTLHNRSWILQLVLSIGPVKGHLPSGMSRLTEFEAQLYFYAVAMMSREARKKMLNIFRNEVNTAMESMPVQLVQMPWDAPAKPCSLGHSEF